MLDKHIADQYKVSNLPNLQGWNTSMTIREMLEQLEGTYGRPNTMTMFANNTLFGSVFSPNNAAESPFYRMVEQCQEIQVLGMFLSWRYVGYPRVAHFFAKKARYST